MNTLKYHLVEIVCAFLVGAFAASIFHHCACKDEAPVTTAPRPGRLATEATPAADPGFDWTLWGQVAALLSASVPVIWRAWQSRNYQVILAEMGKVHDRLDDLKMQPSVDVLAETLHAAGREAVEKGETVAREQGLLPIPFVEWQDASENVKNGRRSQARYLLNRYTLTLKP